MPDMPEITKLPQSGGSGASSVSRPESGTYGEKQPLRELQSLPLQPGGPQAAQPTAPAVGGSGGGTGMPAAPAGLPAGLLRPTARPGEPVQTMPAAPVDPYAGAVDARQRRLRLLDILSTSDQVSPETREWAEIAKQKLIARG